MVRCDHCGWSNNPDGATKCQKCNQELVYHSSDTSGVNMTEVRKPMAESCSKCGYLLSPESVFCPNCGTAVSTASSQTVDPSMKKTMRDVSSDVRQGGYGVPADMKQTMRDVTSESQRPILKATPSETAMNQNQASFRLRPVDMVASEAFAFGADTDAAFEFEGGQWFITDKSGTGSAYVCASRRIALQKGDIVLIGGRRYKFE